MPGFERPPPLHVVMEAARIATLQSYPADGGPSEPFDSLVHMAAQIAQTPIAMVSLIGRDRQRVRAAIGTDLVELPRTVSICNHTIAEPSGELIVPDLSADPRFQAHPLVLSQPGLRFYAGVCLLDSGGYALGTLCALGTEPSSLEPDRLASLRLLAHQAMVALELTRAERDAGPMPGLAEHPRRSGWLGVRTEYASVPRSASEGRRVTSVASGSPAERAGLAVDDIILSIDGRATRRRDDITAALARYAAGGAMRLQIWRAGTLFDCAVPVEPAPEARPAW